MDLSTRPFRHPNPRHWLNRSDGECAYPVGGTGIDLISCCRPCGGNTYCARHRARLRGRRRAPSLEEMELMLRAWGI